MPADKEATLPDLPSDLITTALVDLEKAEKTPELYKIDMGTWHEPLMEYSEFKKENVPTGRCAVCFAGAVMAIELGCMPADMCAPSDFDDATHRKLQALDFFRSGRIGQGLEMLHVPEEKISDVMNQTSKISYAMSSYRESPEHFKDAMRQISEIMRRAGL